MTDRELLELAAKAAGMVLTRWNDGSEAYSSGVGFILESNRIWNPLTDDGDALRLENTLGLEVQWTMLDEPLYASVSSFLDRPGSPVREFERLIEHDGDRGSARRRAGVRAAASLASSSTDGGNHG